MPSTLGMRRTKALLIGINYERNNGHSFIPWEKLNGSHRDVRRMWKFLSHANWAYEEIRTLTDETSPSDVYRDNIIAHLEWLVQDCSPGDQLLLHYSGHGYQRPTRSPTEDDGYDETIVPADCPYPSEHPHRTLTQDSGSDRGCPVNCSCSPGDPHCWKPTYSRMIRDNELRNILVDRLPERATLIAIFDSCHSGSIVDLEYRYLPPPPVRRPSKLRKPRLSVTEGTQNKKNQSNTLALMVLSSMTISMGPAIEPASSHERRSTTGNPTNDEFDYHDGERVQSPIEMTPLHRAFSTGKTLADVLWEHREAYKVNDVGYSRGQVITISAASDTKEMFELPKDNSGLLTDSLITVVQKHNHNVSWCKLIDEMTLLFAIRNAERKQHALEYHVHPVLSTNKAGMNLRDRFQL